MTAAYIAYIAITVIAAIANSYAAYLDFVRHRSIAGAMARKGVPDSWLTPLGLVKVLGALGLLVGFVVPLIGTAAAVGLVLFFICAVGAHLRARFYRLGFALLFLALAVATLAVGIAYRGLW